MIATITKINKKPRFIRVHFRDDDGNHYMTDLVPSFRNYRVWDGLLETGNRLSNLALFDDDRVDADSKPELISSEPKEEDPQLEMF